MNLMCLNGNMFETLGKEIQVLVSHLQTSSTCPDILAWLHRRRPAPCSAPSLSVSPKQQEGFGCCVPSTDPFLKEARAKARGEASRPPSGEVCEPSTRRPSIQTRNDTWVPLG